ncbi:MAG: type II toxin-antitoxin system VapC family toxin [Verrucomicrobiales bacterium]|nr:type II toxin-antitoxin system VapC family toxin [Verrucomicrobiales bacterium]
MILVDTTFLIDLQRSARNEHYQAALLWLQQHEAVEIVLPAIVLGEFAEGFENVDHPVVQHYRRAHRIIDMDKKVAMIYSRISRDLRRRGQSIGANDTWIAATALSLDAPLLTNNISHFERVEGLEVIGYAQD